MKGNRKQAGLRLPIELHEKLMQKAQEMGISFNELLLILIDKGYPYLP